jgi:hypothetical protein
MTMRQTIEELGAQLVGLRLQHAELLAELGHIAHAKRFDRDKFDDDTSFADWAQSRARFAIDRDSGLVRS